MTKNRTTKTINIGLLCIDLSILTVDEYLNMITCYKCSGFRHMADLFISNIAVNKHFYKINIHRKKWKDFI